MHLRLSPRQKDACGQEGISVVSHHAIDLKCFDFKFFFIFILYTCTRAFFVAAEPVSRVDEVIVLKLF